VTLRREFEEEAGNIQDMEQLETFNKMVDELFAQTDDDSNLVFRGYVDDPRNTDNAWMETSAFHFHCSKELGALLPLSAGDDAGAVMWLDVDQSNESYANLYADHKKWVDQVAEQMRVTGRK